MNATSTFGAEDAYVFADVGSGRALEVDAIAAAVQIDQDRMLRDDDAFPLSAMTGRVARAYDSFVTVEGASGAYASRGFARSDAPASGQRAAKAPMIAPMMAPAIVATLFPAR